MWCCFKGPGFKDATIDMFATMGLSGDTMAASSSLLEVSALEKTQACVFSRADTLNKLEGAAMGSPLSPIVANIYMVASLKPGPLKQHHTPQDLWKRYWWNRHFCHAKSPVTSKKTILSSILNSIEEKIFDLQL